VFSSKTVVRQYNKDWLSFGFISSEEEQPRPNCVVRGQKLANRVTVPASHKQSHLSKNQLTILKGV
jgi:hypothetical protein